MNSSTGSFGKFPKAIADSGILANLRRSESLTLLVLVAHTNRRTLESYPSVETIMKLTGLSERTVQRATRGLADKKVITIVQGGGQGNTNKYRLTENPVVLGDTVPNPKPRHLRDTVSKPESRHLDDTVSPVKGVILDPKPRHLGVTRTEEQNKSCALARRRNKSKTKNESNHQALIAHFTDRWSELVGGGGKYPFAKGRDGKAVKTILDAANGDLDRAKAIVDRFLADDDDAFLAKNGRGRSLGLLVSGACLTRYLADTAAPQPQVRSDESIPQDHPLIQDAREKWPDDVAKHPQEWWALATAAEAGDIQGNAVITSDAKSGEEFRAEYNRELARVAN